jgi:hypothetical protein
MAILNLGWFCFKKFSQKKERGNGSEYRWGTTMEEKFEKRK